ncbi:hypothetical protein DV451_000362 [Geotrichum candidum]|uniref:Eukaryotic translation initiation factor 3 subunit L n=1 Tax=Geotrichum candidum TaxID=1173061 RepID=A0A9P5KXP6_GEOCN|nr:hypothetical protein DV451_000362 [Geotrichum candidum]KAF5111462.1 hypothetical protein DV453_000107 [Geotrichum candidum]
MSKPATNYEFADETYYDKSLVVGNNYGFNKLTENFYKTTPWPDPETVVAPLVNDPVFLIFYTEVYYRHLYGLLQPTAEQRFQSYENYCKLFNYILNSEGPVDKELPSYWAWDIIDEFIYQFNTFCIYRNKVIKRGNNTEEINLLKNNPTSWGAYSVLNVLYSLSGKANIKEQLQAIKAGKDPLSVAGEYGSKKLYKTLGYFSLVGLLRVHTLLGDYSLALKTLESIELNKKAFFVSVATAHYTTYYYVGFCYMMLRRYADAIKAFSHILLFISRTKNINRSAQFNAVSKKSDQMYALLAICVALNPTRLDEVVHTGLREKYGEQLYKMQRGGADALALFEELFIFAAPKFVSPSVPDFENNALNAVVSNYHTKLFLADIQNSVTIPLLKKYLNLYATMDISKLSKFLETSPDQLRSILVSYKLKNRQVRWEGGDIVEGEYANTSDVDISLENDLIHISEIKNSRKFADWFIRNTFKNYLLQDLISGKQEENGHGKKDKKRHDKNNN